MALNKKSGSHIPIRQTGSPSPTRTTGNATSAYKEGAFKLFSSCVYIFGLLFGTEIS